ncbi:MAG: hypothetical protein IKV20_00510 [Clostridia bacterium]|nr:hypothetical protein [Clostridia bacterium]
MKRTTEKSISILKRTASDVIKYRVRMKILSILLVLLTTFTGVIYVASALYEQSGSFTINVSKTEMQKYGLSLSETKDMLRPTSSLNAKIAEKMTNIAGETIDANVDMIDGEHNGRDYIAYTFYVQNAGEVEVAYDYEIRMSGVTNGLDEAIRLRLYVDGGEPVDYAKTKSDGTGPEPGTTEFYSATTIVLGRVDAFEPGEQTKFTVVIWIEGNDPDCIDWLIGGKMKLDMQISVAH